MANVTFIFGISPNTKPEEKKRGDMTYYISHLKKWRGYVPRVPRQTAPMAGCLALMRIESDDRAKVYYDEIIDDFVSTKARKVLF